MQRRCSARLQYLGMEWCSMNPAAFRLLGNHLFPVCIECLIDDPFGGIQLLVVFEAQSSKRSGDGFPAGAFGLVL